MIQCHLHCFSTSFLFLHPTPPQDSKQPFCKSNWCIQSMNKNPWILKSYHSVFSLNFFLKCWIFNKKQYLNLRIFKITKLQTPIHVSYKLLRYPLGAPYTSPPASNRSIAMVPMGWWDLVVFKPCLRQNQTLHMTSKSHLTVVLSLCECWSVGQKGVGTSLELVFFFGRERGIENQRLGYRCSKKARTWETTKRFISCIAKRFRLSQQK